jgi:hypothetical protein
MKNKNILSKLASALILSVAIAHTATAAPSDVRGELRDRSSRDDRDRNDRSDRDSRNDRNDRDSRNDRNDRDSRDRDNRDRFDRQKATQIVKVFYRAILFREGEPAGVQYHVDLITKQGEASIPVIAQGIATSPEFRQNVDRRYSPEQILSNMYRQVFGRDVDPSGRNSYLPMIRQGQAGAVMKSLASSAEFRQRYLR